AVTGSGGVIALACFTEGLVCYALAGPRQRRLPQAAPCARVSLSYTGDAILTAGLDDRVALRDRFGAERGSLSLGARVTALALGALGESAVVGLADGRVVKLATGEV